MGIKEQLRDCPSAEALKAKVKLYIKLDLKDEHAKTLFGWLQEYKREGRI